MNGEKRQLFLQQFSKASPVGRAGAIGLAGMMMLYTAAGALAGDGVSVRPIAKQTLEAIKQTEVTVYYAIKSKDGSAIQDRVVWPLIRLIGKWPKYAEVKKSEFNLFACYHAADNLRNFADLVVGPDNADRAEARDYYAAEYKVQIEDCEKLLK